MKERGGYYRKVRTSKVLPWSGPEWRVRKSINEGDSKKGQGRRDQREIEKKRVLLEFGTRGEVLGSGKSTVHGASLSNHPPQHHERGEINLYQRSGLSARKKSLQPERPLSTTTKREKMGGGKKRGVMRQGRVRKKGRVARA